MELHHQTESGLISCAVNFASALSRLYQRKRRWALKEVNDGAMSLPYFSDDILTGSDFLQLIWREGSAGSILSL